jgi:hypothetical protein
VFRNGRAALEKIRNDSLYLAKRGKATGHTLTAVEARGLLSPLGFKTCIVSNRAPSYMCDPVTFRAVSWNGVMRIMNWVLIRRCSGAALTLCVLSVLPGCLIPYGFPKVSQTPLLSLGNDPGEIHAFRVDITREFADISGVDNWTFSEVSPWSMGWVLPQTKVSATYGIFVFGVALNYPVYMSHSLALRVYRPGFDLVELDSWDIPAEIVWKQAADLCSQERALDRLLLMSAEEDENKPRQWLTVGSRLSPGSQSAEHRRVLLFGASEYERLASKATASGPESEAANSRLQSKAQELRKLADTEKPSPSFSRLLRGE